MSARVGTLLHGLADRRACFSCHATLAVEPDTPLDIRVHRVHSRSERFRSLADIRNCAQCHLTAPDGPFRDRGEQGLTAPLVAAPGEYRRWVALFAGL